MPGAIAFIQWENYSPCPSGSGFFAQEPLSFNSRQDRLHALQPGGRLWLVSRCSEDRQYYFVAVVRVEALRKNLPQSEIAQQHGEYGVIGDRALSYDLGKQFPAEALIRALEFEHHKPVQYGASLGQSLQSIRVLSAQDESL